MMHEFDPSLFAKLYKPASSSHKGQNGKLLLIGGSKLFHAASLWSLQIASKIVDMVFYASVPENNEIVQKAKEEFRNGIVIRRDQIASYIKEADCIVIGPGLPRDEGEQIGDDDTKTLTEGLLRVYPNKKWVIDGGSLQEIDIDVLLGLKQTPILTPHLGEFDRLKLKIKNEKFKMTIENSRIEEQVDMFAKEYKCVVLLKGQEDIVCSPASGCVKVSGGNAGMTKGGTGDVLAGLVGALFCKNDAFLAASCASYINKKAGEALFEKVGYYFNSTDLVNEIPHIMKQLIL